MATKNEIVLNKINDIYRMLFDHPGYGEMTIEMRYLRKREKEVIIKCGKQYRFVVATDEEPVKDIGTPPED